jgi:hypothetical protein
MALTKEEAAELAALEADEKTAASLAADAAARQHLEALKARKRLKAKYGEHGRDFLVLETTIGVNVAIRRPLEVEIDAVAEDGADDRGPQESYVKAITIEPPPDEIARLLATWPGLTNAIIPKSFDLIGRLRQEEGKK